MISVELWGKQMKAKPVDGVVIQSIEKLPSGVTVLIVPCADWDVFRTLPNIVEYDNQLYGRSAWNSDRYIAYYRSDCKVAVVPESR